MRKNEHELSDDCHEEILQQAPRRFPLESYRELRATGASREEALEMLGFRQDEVPDNVRD